MAEKTVESEGTAAVDQEVGEQLGPSTDTADGVFEKALESNENRLIEISGDKGGLRAALAARLQVMNKRLTRIHKRLTKLGQERNATIPTDYKTWAWFEKGSYHLFNNVLPVEIPKLSTSILRKATNVLWDRIRPKYPEAVAEAEQILADNSPGEKKRKKETAGTSLKDTFINRLGGFKRFISGMEPQTSSMSKHATGLLDRWTENLGRGRIPSDIPGWAGIEFYSKISTYVPAIMRSRMANK